MDELKKEVNETTNIAPLLKHVFMFLEDGDWESADEYCERVLDIDPKNAKAYLGKLLAELKVDKVEHLENCTVPFSHLKNYEKVMRFGDDDLKKTIQGYSLSATENNRIEKEKQDEAFRVTPKANRKKFVIFSVIACILIAVISILTPTVINNVKYNKAVDLTNQEIMPEPGPTFMEIASNFKDIRGNIIQLSGETISAGNVHTVGLKADGTVVAVGSNAQSQCNVDKWTDIVAVSAGDYYTVGLKADGTVVAVGDNYKGQCYVGNWTDIVAISTYSFHTVGLKLDGTVVAVGWNEHGQCNVGNWTDIVAVSAGGYHTVGLKADGTVVAVGDNGFEQCNVDNWTDIVAVSCGEYHTVGLKADGTVVAVGWNHNGQCNVDNWTDIVAVSGGADHTVGLKSDGTVVATKYFGLENFYGGQCDVSGWRNIVAISAGFEHTVGIKSDGTAIATRHTGTFKFGQCNVDNWTDIKVYK